MENKGLIFIPDISGFTRFINQTEIEHSRLIIQELLEIIINANQIGLEVSEIEGDAVLFYKFGEHSDLEELYQQVKKMFCEFHRSLIAYDKFKFCQCAACLAAAGLSLKVITHYGEFTGYNVKNFQKLIGKDVIVAHQLLKNNIPQDEYWLVTENLLPGHLPDDFAAWMKWNSSAKQTESGNISFYYTQLSELKNELPPDPHPQLEISKKAKMISLTREYETDIITLFHATGDFNFRSRWQEGVKRVEEIGHFLPRVGMHCRLVHQNGEVITYASSYSFTPERIEFSETDEKKKYSTYYILEKINNHKTRLTLDYYIAENAAGQIIFKLMKKRKMEDTLRRSMRNLENLVKEIRLN
ncbi:MAG TPA: DUF2652 domain-containing protein [Bacteroidia bacterium]|nr:DUF2652 domain-containing protein [Bacteroidia bacterium]